MKIYTKTGDKGKTSLYGGARLSKDDIRIEAYGTVDELNSYMGWIAALPGKLVDFGFFQRIQSNLFNIGSHLAAGEENEYPLPELDTELTERLESEMDRMNEKLPKLKSFVLPGGCVENGLIHVARTVCRRSERRVVTLSHHHEVDPDILVFLNRLSDYLFVLSRYASLKADADEVPWVGMG
jgi:cob(I)alamin adenosyltransferase